MAELNGSRNKEEILTTIYVFVDDFLKVVLMSLSTAIEAPKITQQNSPRKQRQLCLAELVTLGLFRFYVGISNWKSFYEHMVTYHSKDFPDLPHYSRFVEGVNATSPVAVFLVQVLGDFFAAKMPLDEPKLADSSRLRVCEIKREFSHKVCRGIAAKSKSTMGWFYGFKLHIIANRLLKMRQAVETVFSVLKLRFGLESTLPRSTLGFFAHYFWALAAYQLKQFFKHNLFKTQLRFA